jgi:hypothetical protein
MTTKPFTNATYVVSIHYPKRLYFQIYRVRLRCREPVTFFLLFYPFILSFLDVLSRFNDPGDVFFSSKEAMEAKEMLCDV